MKPYLVSLVLAYSVVVGANAQDDVDQRTQEILNELMEIRTPAIPSQPGNDAPGKSRSEWTGIFDCLASATDTAKVPAYSAPFTLTVSGIEAVGNRVAPSITEVLKGTLESNGSLRLSGIGQRKSGEGQPWTTTISGTFAADKFTGNGAIYETDSRQARNCTVSLTRLGQAPSTAAPVGIGGSKGKMGAEDHLRPHGGYRIRVDFAEQKAAGAEFCWCTTANAGLDSVCLVGQTDISANRLSWWVRERRDAHADCYWSNRCQGVRLPHVDRSR